MECTEPIAVAYSWASIARHTLGTVHDKVELIVSENIINDVKV